MSDSDETPVGVEEVAPATNGARIVHVVERHIPIRAGVKRAVDSWSPLYHDNVIGVHLWDYPRSSQDIGDMRKMPYLKDLLRIGMDECEENDVLMMTNGDTILHRDTAKAVMEHMSRFDCVCSFRINIETTTRIDGSPVACSRIGKHDFGRDLFAFRKSWLERKMDEIPDFLVGECEWDLVMALMIRMSNNVEISTKHDLGTLYPDSELPFGYVLHELHDRIWMTPASRYSPAKRHNIDLANAWYSRNGLDSFVLHWL